MLKITISNFYSKINNAFQMTKKPYLDRIIDWLLNNYNASKHIAETGTTYVSITYKDINLGKIRFANHQQYWDSSFLYIYTTSSRAIYMVINKIGDNHQIECVPIWKLRNRIKTAIATRYNAKLRENKATNNITCKPAVKKSVIVDNQKQSATIEDIMIPNIPLEYQDNWPNPRSHWKEFLKAFCDSVNIDSYKKWDPTLKTAFHTALTFGGHSISAAASYEVFAKHVNTGMGLRQAAQLTGEQLSKLGKQMKTAALIKARANYINSKLTFNYDADVNPDINAAYYKRNKNVKLDIIRNEFEKVIPVIKNFAKQDYNDVDRLLNIKTKMTMLELARFVNDIYDANPGHSPMWYFKAAGHKIKPLKDTYMEINEIPLSIATKSETINFDNLSNEDYLLKKYEWYSTLSKTNKDTLKSLFNSGLSRNELDNLIDKVYQTFGNMKWSACIALKAEVKEYKNRKEEAA